MSLTTRFMLVAVALEFLGLGLALQEPAAANRPRLAQMNEGHGGSPYAYACDGVNTCYVYDRRGHAIGSVVGLAKPEGTFADPAGNWHIANSGAGTVLEFSPGGGKLENTLTDLGESPFGVGISVSTRTVAVGNASNSVSVYVGGATSPTRVLKGPSRLVPHAFAVDADGNCYLGGSAQGGYGWVEQFDGCAGRAKQVDLGGVFSIVGVAFDGASHLYASDEFFGAGWVFKCVHLGPGCEQLIFKTSGAYFPTSLAFDAAFDALLIADGPTIYKLAPRGRHRHSVFATIGSGTAAGVSFAVGPTY